MSSAHSHASAADDSDADDDASDRESFVEPAPSPPRPLHRFSGSGSMGSSRSSGSSRRFRAPPPALRRSLAQDSDPCMLAASYQDDYSDDEEQDEEDRCGHSTSTAPASPLRPAMLRSQTEKPQKTTAAAASPMEPLFIRVRKFASTSALETKPAADAADALEQGALEPELNSAVTEDDDDGSLLRAARFSPRPSSARAVAAATAAASPPAPPVESTPASVRAGFRRWYGRILNSYFAFWLVACSLAVLLLNVVVLLLLVALRHEKQRDAAHALAWCHAVTRGALHPLHYLGAAACVLLALPVVLPCRALQLYAVRRGDGRLLRRPYLHVCELLAVAEVALLLYVALDASGGRSPLSLACQRVFSLAERAFLLATALLWLVLWAQLVVFCRFRVHLALQADAADAAAHTADWHWRRHNNASFQKRLYRAAARGDAAQVDALLAATPLASALYAARPTLWLGVFARAAKHPLHVAAARGHAVVVARLLRAGFSANALDKVARVNFNLGLLFTLVTRAFVKTQDSREASKAPLLGAVLLPPLHGAVANGHVAVVRLLLERGHADANLAPKTSFLAPQARLPAVFLADDPHVLALLVAHGANVLRVSDPRHETPLQHSSSLAASALLATGADVALTPLHAAAAADDLATLQRLLATGASMCSVDVARGVLRRTPLHWAAVAGSVASAALLLSRGADANAADRHGRTPLHWAARRNHAAVVALLLSHGGDATRADHSGASVLLFAAEADGVGVAVVAALLAHGASLSAHGGGEGEGSGGGDTPLHVALARENRLTAVALIRCGADLVARNRAGVRAVDVSSSTQLQLLLKREAGTRDVMLSYPHAAFALAQRVRARLESEAQATCWMDTMDPSGIGGGAVWREEIARGIFNCALVVSVVAEGYARSPWCLKELALARMLRKPVLALMVGGGEEEGGEMAALVPREARVRFPVGDKEQEEEAWRSVLPRVKHAISEGGSGGATDSEPEQEDVGGGGGEEERKGEEGRTSPVRVAVCSTLAESELRDRLVRDLDAAAGVHCERLLLSSEEGSEHEEGSALGESDVLVLLLESVADSAQRAAATASLERMLLDLRRRWPKLRVVPVVARRNFLSFSNLYTLSRSQLLYFVQGLGECAAQDALLRQLQSVARDRRPRACSLPGRS